MELLEVHIDIPVGATLNNIYRNERHVTLQFWATSEARDQIMLALTGSRGCQLTMTEFLVDALCAVLVLGSMAAVVYFWRQRK